MSLRTLCNNTATRLRKTTTQSPGGGQVPTYAPTGDPFACSIQPVDGHTRAKFAQERMSVSHRLHSPTPITAEAGDRLKDENNVTYDVKWTGDQAGRGRVFVAYLFETRS